MTAARPRIGVTRWEDVPGERIEDYWERIEAAGGSALDLHREGDAAALDALVLTGGYDIEPARYRAERHPKVKQIDPERDAFELALLADVLEHDLPVLAICRGSQVLNVALRGGLLQHIDDRSHVADYRTEGYPSQWHRVRIEPDSRLHAVFGRDASDVNSRHHQAVTVDRLGDGLRAVATAPDGLVEATESAAHRWVVGVQWHPERLEPERPHFAPEQRALFEAFVREAGRVTTRT